MEKVADCPACGGERYADVFHLCESVTDKDKGFARVVVDADQSEALHIGDKPVMWGEDLGRIRDEINTAVRAKVREAYERAATIADMNNNSGEGGTIAAEIRKLAEREGVL